MSNSDLLKAGIEIERLRRKLKTKDSKISGLNRRISDLEHKLALRVLDFQRLPLDITRAVQDAPCNIRMIPVLGVGRGDKIVTVQAEPAKKE